MEYYVRTLSGPMMVQIGRDVPLQALEYYVDEKGGRHVLLMPGQPTAPLGCVTRIDVPANLEFACLADSVVVGTEASRFQP